MVERDAVAAVVAGPTWRHSAEAIRDALARGLSVSVLAARAGIAEAVLHRWRVALEVCDTLDAAALGEVALSRLDAEGTDEILYALRRLPRDVRTAAARYLLERQLPAAAAETLVEALLECRRSGAAEGFPCVPGDALAFRRWLQARSSTLPAERERYLREGLALAETEPVRERFRAALAQEMSGRAGGRPLRTAAVPVRWADPAHALPRLVPYLPDPGELGRGAPAWAPLGREGPAWAWYEVPGGRYVALPGWPEVTGLVRPVAVPCPAALLPVAGLGQASPPAPVLVVVETGGTAPAAGEVWFLRQEEAVVARVIGPEGPTAPEVPVGRVALVVSRAARASAADEDGEADLDCWG